MLPGGQDDLVSIDVHGPFAHDSAVGEQLVIRQEDSGQPGRLDQGPQRRDIVHECVFAFHEGDVDMLVERPGERYATVAAANDHHR